MSDCSLGYRASVRGALAWLVSAVALLSMSSAANGSPLVIGGSQTTIDHVPWQVALHIEDPAALCGGSILDAKRVLTAAHCVLPDGGAQHKPADITVLAGFSDINTYTPGKAPPAGTQVIGVSAIRVHPYYAASTNVDDVAVLTLAKALNLSGTNAKAIALAPTSAGPAPGSPVGVSGYGQQDESRPVPDGKLYAAGMTTLSDDACRDRVSDASAVLTCVQSPSAAPCHGDSGGPVTTGSGPVAEIGVVSSGPAGGCASGPTTLADVTAPEVRAFIDGASAIPVAPRAGGPAQITTVMPPVVGSPVTCESGAWNGAPSLAYTFQADDASQLPLQAGPANVYIPRARDVGKPVVCVLQASNAGGTSTERTGTTPADARDKVRPRSAITFVRCKGRTCRLLLRAADSNSQGALRIAVTAHYSRACRRRHGHRSSCSGSRAFRVTKIGSTKFRATGTRLPARRLRVLVRVTDAAGNHARSRHVSVTPRR